MTKTGKSTVLESKGKIYLYVPHDVSVDSAFPFKKGDKILIRVVKDKLVIEKES